MIDLTEFEKSLLLEIQDGIPLSKKPYEEISEELGVSSQKVIDTLEKLLNDKKIRRIGASLNHRKIGFSANAMIVWNIPQNKVQETAKNISKFDEVSHCYERPKKEGWNYNLFTMVHGKDESECKEIAKRISDEIGIKDFDVLFSTREFKKTGVKLPKK